MATSQHSRLAMKAARRMARSDHKLKTGRSICHHLLMMIEDSEVACVPRLGQVVLQVVDTAKQNRKQYSLSL